MRDTKQLESFARERSEKEKEKYLNKEKHPLPQIVGSWRTHYISWKNMKKNYILVKYEDLIQNTHKEFTKVANFLGKLIRSSFSEEAIENAIKLSSFDKLLLNADSCVANARGFWFSFFS